MVIPLFHDGMRKLQRWNHFDQRVKLFVSSTKQEERYLCGRRLLATFDPEGNTFQYVRDDMTDVQLEAADGSGAPDDCQERYVSRLVPSQFRKVFGCCWISSDLILFDEITEKP